MKTRMLVFASLALVATAGCPPNVNLPAGFPKLPVPDDNPLTQEKIDLGKQLFFETQLSRTGDVACASCHLPENAFAEPKRVSEGVEGRTGDRNAPPLFNLAWNTSFFWDGRAPTLEEQALGPIQNPLEMDMTLDEAVARLNADRAYVQKFEVAFGRKPDALGMGQALASFMRTLISGSSRFDRSEQGEVGALSEAEERGREVFFSERAECFHCHVGFNLTNNAFHNNGAVETDPDLGRQLVTGRASDRGKFKVPSLRNVGVTAPYMHDGSLATLEEVVEHYARGGRGSTNTDPTIHHLELTAQEKEDLVHFLKALTDEAFLKDSRFQAQTAQ